MSPTQRHCPDHGRLHGHRRGLCRPVRQPRPQPRPGRAGLPAAGSPRQPALGAGTASTSPSRWRTSRNRSDLERIEQLIAHDPHIGVLVNNAGMAVSKPIIGSTPDDFQKLIDLNVTAATRLGIVGRQRIREARRWVDHQPRRPCSGVAHEIGGGVYGGSKAFVLNFSRALHAEGAEPWRQGSGRAAGRHAHRDLGPVGPRHRYARPHHPDGLCTTWWMLPLPVLMQARW